MFKRRMKQEQIDAQLDEIRGLYDQYISKYCKPAALKDGFNERYYDAIRMRMDMGGFFKNETNALQALIEQAAGSLQKEAEEKVNKKKVQKKKRDTADRIHDENLKRIEKYPDYLFHEEASYDIVKLLGAMRRYEHTHWQELSSLFRLVGTGRQMEERMALELRWREFCSQSSGALPTRVVKYQNLLDRRPRDPVELEWEERQILYDTARFLGALSDFIRQFLLIERLEIGTVAALKEKKEELDGILSDFRLNDLAKLSGRKYL